MRISSSYKKGEQLWHSESVNAKDVVNSISVNEHNQSQNKTQTIMHFKIELIFNVNADNTIINICINAFNIWI